MNNNKEQLNPSNEEIQSIISLYNSGKFVETIEAINILNNSYPGVPLFFNILGLCYNSLRQFDSSLEMFKAAIEIKKDYFEAYKNLGVTYINLSQLNKAIDSFKKAVSINPNYIDAHYHLANTLKDFGSLNDAISSYQKVIELNPNIAEVHNNLANTLKDLGRLDDALESYKKAIKINPSIAEVHNNLANTLKDQGLLNDALEAYLESISINPNFAEAYYNKGIVLKTLRKFEDAITDFKKAISIRANFSGAYNNLASAYLAIGHTTEAIENCEKALSINPNYAEAFNNYGNILVKLRRSDAAKTYYEKAIEIKPEYAQAYVNLGAIYKDKKNGEKALLNYLKAYEMDPEIDFIIGDILNIKMNLCIWDDLSSNLIKIKNKIIDANKVISPFPLLSLIDDPKLQSKASKIFAKYYYPRNDELSKITPYINHQKIRIGYFSADFKIHAVATLTAELFETHNRNQFEIHAFSFGPNTNDEMNLRIKKGVDHFHNVLEFSDIDIVKLARKHEIDIAVDLGGFTARSRTAIFAMSAAPIQISYIGYLGTMGADYYDYLIADNIMIPEKNQKFFLEKIVYLQTFQVNDSKETLPDISFSKKDFGLPEKNFIFCCFNNTYKITPNTFDSWARILKSVKKSVLMIYVNNELSQKNLIKEIIARGVDSTRLIFGGKLSRSEYLARYKVADLFLDTSPYNAGTTASDALKMGLPVLTLKGNAYQSRMAASILSAVNLPELITNSQQEYELLAIELAKNPDKLKNITDKLASNLKIAPLFNTPLFTKNLESAYAKMHKRYRKGLNPEHIITEC